MLPHDAQTEVMKRIQAMPNAPHVVWPDDGSPPDSAGTAHPLPRYVMQRAGGAQRTMTIRGLTQAEPEVSVRVETRSGYFEEQSAPLVRALVEAFPLHLRFSGLIVIQAPDVRAPSVSGDVRAVPVFIRVRTYY